MELSKRVKLRKNGGEERSNHKDSTVLPNLPLDLVMEILLRLPARSVGRFRCVSKLFGSLLSDPKFAKNHVDFILQNNVSRHRRLIMYFNNLFSVDFDRDGYEGIRDLTVVELDLDLLCKMREETGTYKCWGGTKVSIVGSANGLVCTSTSWRETFVFLYNPTTGESKRIPDLPQSLRTEFTNVLLVEVHGFGFDALTDDYKVVKFVFNSMSIERRFTAYLYSLKSDSWRQISGLRYHNFIPNSSGVLLNGTLHWIAILKESNERVVATFDIKTEEFGEMSLPDEAENFHNLFTRLEVGNLKGRLCVTYSYYGMQNDIWVMNEYGVKSSWTKIQLSVSYETLKPVCSTTNDGEVLLMLDKHLVLYNFENNTSRILEINGVDFSDFCRWPEADTYVESLISPNSYGVERAE